MILMPVVLVRRMQDQTVTSLFESEIIATEAVHIRGGNTGTRYQLMLHSPENSFLGKVEIVARSQRIYPFQMPESIKIPIIARLDGTGTHYQTDSCYQIYYSFHNLFSFIKLELDDTLSCQGNLETSIVSQHLCTAEIHSVSCLYRISSQEVVAAFCHEAYIMMLLGKWQDIGSPALLIGSEYTIAEFIGRLTIES